MNFDDWLSDALRARPLLPFSTRNRRLHNLDVTDPIETIHLSKSHRFRVGSSAVMKGAIKRNFHDGCSHTTQTTFTTGAIRLAALRAKYSCCALLQLPSNGVGRRCR